MKDAITLIIIETLVLKDSLTFEELCDETFKKSVNKSVAQFLQTDIEGLIGLTIFKLAEGDSPLISRKNPTKICLTAHGQQFSINLLRNKQKQINNLLEKLPSVNIKNHELV